MDTQPTRLQPILQWASQPRIRAFGIAIVVLAVLAILQVQTLDRPKPMCELLEGCRLQSADIQRLQVAFGQAGLSEFEVEGHSLRVPSEQHKKYMQVATEQRAIPANLLPQESQAPTFNPFMSRAQQRAVELNNKKQEVRSMVELLPFVDQAWFEMDRSESGNAFRPARQSAVISVRSMPDIILTDRHMESIKRMISGAVADLPTENIVVVDLDDGLAHQELVDASTERQIQVQRISFNQQRFYEAQIREALSEYPELKIRVSVNVEEAEEVVEDKVASMPPREPMLPTAGANGVVSIQVEPAPVSSSKVQFATYRKPIYQHRIAVSVDVPEATLFQVLGKPEIDVNRHRSAKARELAFQQETLARFNQLRRQLTQRIEDLLPANDTAGANQIAVNLLEAPPAEVAANGWETALNLVQLHWPSVAVVAIGLVLLTIVTRNPVAEETVSTPPNVDVLDINNSHATDAEVRLSQMIEEDPDAAARIIETWIRDAA